MINARKADASQSGLKSLSLDSLSAKIMAAAGLMMVLSVGSNLTGNWVAGEFRTTSQEMTRRSEMLRNHLDADMMHDALRGDSIALMLAAKSGDAAGLKEGESAVAEHVARFEENLHKNEQLARTKTEKELLAALDQPLKDYAAAAGKIAKAAQLGVPQTEALMPDFQARFSALEEAMGAASDTFSAEVAAVDAEAARASALAEAIMLGLLLLAIGAGVGVMIGGKRKVIQPLHTMCDEMEALASGDVNAEIHGVDRPDELGRMARAIAQFRENAIAAARAEHEAELARQAEAAAARKIQDDQQRKFLDELLGVGQAMKLLASGDTHTPVAGLDRQDEIGEMARSVEVFRENAIKKAQADRDAEMQREQIERQRVANAKAEAAKQEAQQAVVAQLAQGLERLANGDLRHTLNEPFAPEYEKLRSDYNAAVNALRDVLQSIAGNAHSVMSNAGSVNRAAIELSSRTENQAASLEETAAALDEITATVQRTSQGAEQARGVAANAFEAAKLGGAVVAETVTAMAAIDQSSKQISQIIGVIDEISFQTNLLALNAGVEAARAGDAGRGFAVVAQEVRALAQRAADAAKEIKGLISTSSTHVESGTKLAAQAGDALQKIVSEVTQVRSRISEIADSAREQATGLAEVNTAMNQMDQVTQRNAAMVEETTAASETLSNEAQELSRAVATFQLPAGSSMAMNRRAA